jgi:hypothetical protein
VVASSWALTRSSPALVTAIGAVLRFAGRRFELTWPLQSRPLEIKKNSLFFCGAFGPSSWSHTNWSTTHDLHASRQNNPGPAPLQSSARSCSVLALGLCRAEFPRPGQKMPRAKNPRTCSELARER